MKWFSLLFLAFLISGCATQRVNWQTRVGNYTYDNAVHEYGPADKRDQLSDGTVVADWIVREGHAVTVPQPYLTGPDGMGAARPVFNSGYMPAYFMELTFGPDGKLASYKNYYR